MTDRSPLVRYLVERGLLDDTSRPPIEERSASHRVAIVGLAPQRLVVKDTVGADGGRDRPLDRELLFYQLAAHEPEIAAVTPRARWLDPKLGRLVLDAVEPGRPVDLVDDESTLDAAFTAVSALHRARGAGWRRFPPEIPWVLALFRRRAWVPDAARQALADPTRRAEVRSVIRRADDDWRAHCIVHGDLRAANVLHHGSMPGGELRIIDWETVSFGDARWDLASLTADAIVGSLLVGRHDRAQALMPKVDNELYVKARLVQLAIEAAAAGSGSSAVDEILRFATSPWVGTVAGKSQSPWTR